MNESTAWQDIDAALGNEYILVREAPLAAGFSSFEAKSKRDGSAVEIKSVPASIFAGRTPLKDSDLAGRKLQHPNILPVVAAGLAGDSYFWLSPAVEGRTLRTRLSRGGRIEIGDSLTVLRDVSAALTHAHLHGVVHGGLTPDSVVISGGSALVADVGIPEVFAALRSAGTSAAAMNHTSVEPLRYSPPELGSAGHADARSDVYSWGVLAYELLGGRHPFAGRNTPRQMLAAHADEDPQPLSSGHSAVPSTVSRLVMRALSKDPSKRPESAREVLAVLTKEMLVPPPAPAAGAGQKFVIAMMIGAMLLLAAITWLGTR